MTHIPALTRRAFFAGAALLPATCSPALAIVGETLCGPRLPTQALAQEALTARAQAVIDDFRSLGVCIVAGPVDQQLYTVIPISLGDGDPIDFDNDRYNAVMRRLERSELRSEVERIVRLRQSH